MSTPQTQPKVVEVSVYPSEMKYIRPLETIAEYIRSRSSGERVSRHHVARIFNPLEELVVGASGKSDTIAKIIDLFARHYGLSGEQEVSAVREAVAKLVDYVSVQKSINSVKAFKILRNMRVLLIGMATGQLSSITFTPLERRPEKSERS